MADNTLLGVAGVVLISLIAALFLAVGSGTESIDTSIGTGQAAYQGMQNVDVCSAQRICDGSKLIIIREDCTTAEAFCAEGCDPFQGLCV